jgi:hypothetical protein
VLALALAAGLALPSAGRVAAQQPSGAPLIYEGPGGRVRLSTWSFRLDAANRGIRLGFQRGHFTGTTVSVPNVVDPSRYAGTVGAGNYDGSIAWYRTTFTAPAAGVYALSFQSANFLAQVWVDGHPLGSHRGSYLPFEERARVGAGTHAVVLRIDWRDPERQAHEGFHRTWFNWGGLDGEATVRKIGLSELSEPTLQTTLAHPRSGGGPARVRIAVRVRNDGPRRTLSPTGTLTDGTQVIPLSFPAVALGHGKSARETISVSVPEPALWSPLHPNLYSLSLGVGEESSYVARVGLRQLIRHGANLYLNGARLRLHGASIQSDALGHGDALTPADEDAFVSELKQINANAVRTQHPLDPALLERLDAAGILVWQEIGPVEGAGAWFSTSPRLLAQADEMVRAAARAAVLHPSIFAWNLADEIARNGHDPSEVSYVESSARWLHSYDPTRIVAIDVWGDDPPQVAGPLYSDIDAVAETDYSGWYDSPHSSPTQQVAQMRSRLAAMARTFPGRVLVVSEFGADANRLNPAGAPGSFSFQAQLLQRHISVYAADPGLTAMFLWLLRDYPLNPAFKGGSIHHVLPQVRLIEALSQKGIFTYGGQPKPAVPAIARAYRALGGP